jgi:2-haloacid dehalogenase
MIDPETIQAVTFDCYGTLIDWETGLLAALQPVLVSHGVSVGDEALLEWYAGVEAAEERAPYQPYRLVLRRVMERLGAEFGFVPDATEARCLEEAIPGWSPFEDVVPALRSLSRAYRLAVISNIDDDLFAATARRLPVRFDAVITAQSVGSYKPSPENFLQAIRTLALPPESILHVAQSLYHDVAPASLCGISTVWVNRRRGRPGAGATPPAVATPYLEVPDLRALVRALVSLAG